MTAFSKRALALAACVLALATPAAAWWCTGHMLVAQIARQTLSPAALQRLDPVIALFGKDFPETPDFVQSACWADDIKAQSLTAMESWHFVDLPYIRTMMTGSLPSTSTNQNVIWAIEQLTRAVNRTDASDWTKGFAARNLIHFVGDLHQPLHTMTLYDDAHFPAPQGDMGGNKFSIRGTNVTQLHAFWDSGAGMWADDWSRPLNGTSYSQLLDLAAGIMQQFPITQEAGRLTSANPADWARESFSLGVKFTYDLDPGTVVTDNYVANARALCREQVAVGGYRLAQLLETHTALWR